MKLFFYLFIIFYLEIQLITSTEIISKKNFSSNQSECCMYGVRQGEKFRDCGAVEWANVAVDIDPLDFSCFSIMNDCCLNIQLLQACYYGREAARHNNDCNDPFESIHFKHHTARYKLCCDSCRAGLKSGREKSSCNELQSRKNHIWNDNYSICCEKSLEMKNTTKKMRKRRENKIKEFDGLENICDLFPGELCQHICQSDHGSYKCQCYPGYRLLSDGKSCEHIIPTSQINCADNNPCSQNCMEIIDGVICTCYENYILQADNVTCLKDVRSARNDSEFNCQKGYYYNTLQRKCEDINECSTVKCSFNEKCVNMLGSYECVCSGGFAKNPFTRACEDIDECTTNTHNCLSTQLCDNTVGSYNCLRGTSCGTGYAYNTLMEECQDLDECELGLHTCNIMGNNYKCINTRGSFRCDPIINSSSQVQVRPQSFNQLYCGSNTPCYSSIINCPYGFKLEGSNCIDINECESSENICPLTMKCINVVGSYICKSKIICGTGLKPTTDEENCQDINECLEIPKLCSDNCINMWGSYRCTCERGYILDNDNKTCKDFNECDTAYKYVCHGTCMNVPGSYKCICPEGYRLGIDGILCTDIDECSLNICKENEHCINMRGTYRCITIECPQNFEKDSLKQNRCNNINYCFGNNDTPECQEPSSYTYNFISLISNLSIPVSGSIQLFSLRMTTNMEYTDIDFDLSIYRTSVPLSVKKATINDFKLIQTSMNEVHIGLIESIEGPQDIGLKLDVYYRNGTIKIGYLVSQIDIFISHSTI